ncbi:MAG: hypothetical protein B0A82_27055 [Alkalinema sp. CACIAM 70d]|nr:MAG: hypothetical protein B0A82_27055 [Alkalinema sp. CACIAM 70d]
MSFRKITAKTAAVGALATAATVGMMSFQDSAQAAIIGSGGFILNGTTTVSNAGTNSPTIQLSGFSVINKYGAFSGLSGTPTIKSLLLSDPGVVNKSPATAGTYSNNAVVDFITGLTLNGKSLSFDLDASFISLYGWVKDFNDFSIAGPITGTFRSGNTVLGKGFLGANSIEPGGPISSISLTATSIPTPALLPGLVGMGISLIRKRKRQLVEMSNA